MCIVQNAFWQSGSDSRWFWNKTNWKNNNGTRDPPPLNGESFSRRLNGKKGVRNRFFLISWSSVYRYCQEKFFVFGDDYNILTLFTVIPHLSNYGMLTFHCLMACFSLFLPSQLILGFSHQTWTESIIKIQAVIEKNNQNLTKTDEMDLFFGKCGANSIDEAPKPISIY